MEGFLEFLGSVVEDLADDTNVLESDALLEMQGTRVGAVKNLFESVGAPGRSAS